MPAAPTWLYWFDESHFDFSLEGKMRIESTFLACFPWPGILQAHSRWLASVAVNVIEDFEIRQLSIQPSEMCPCSSEQWA